MGGGWAGKPSTEEHFPALFIALNQRPLIPDIMMMITINKGGI
jgi:hypothetical protein